MMNQFMSIVTSTLSMSVPLVLAALGGVLSVRSGVMALGLESMMTMGAFCGVLGSYYTGNVFAGLLTGMAGGALFGLAHAVLCVRYKVNQVISGIGLNLLSVAATTLLMQLLWDNKGSSPQVASINAGVFASPITYIMLFAVIAEYVVLFKTRFGLRLRMVGENPKAAASVGLAVHRIKYIGVVACGVLAGLGGRIPFHRPPGYVCAGYVGRTRLYCGGNHDPRKVQPGHGPVLRPDIRFFRRGTDQFSGVRSSAADYGDDSIRGDAVRARLRCPPYHTACRCRKA